MKRIAIYIAVWFATMGAMAQNYQYNMTENKLTAAELNAKTEATYIAIKNLSRTNNYYFVGNTGGVPYSTAAFSQDAVFIWEPVKGEIGKFYLKKLDGTYMQTSSPKDFSTIEGAAKLSAANPTSKGNAATFFNGDGDSKDYINGNDDIHLVRFVNGSGKWINVQNGDSGTPTYNTGTGGWTIHYAYELVMGEAEPEPEPEPLDANKVYYLQWKSTGEANHVTEMGRSLIVAPKNTGKFQFWRFVPTGKDNCYYIQNVVSQRYIGSCNMEPSSASRVTMSDIPIEYYVVKTSAAGGEIAGCYYMSSTDCTDYNNEGQGPRALNKDGASSYIITWQAGTSRVGSYWKIVETVEEYQRPEPPVHTDAAKQLAIYFNPCGMVGTTWLTAAKINGVIPIAYSATGKPGSYHVLYSKDHGVALRGSEVDINITLNAATDDALKAIAFFDWNADGEFEATQPITLNGTAGTATVIVPDDAICGDTRMRIRINSNGLDYAEDDVEGFVYDFHFAVVDSATKHNVTVGVNSNNCGTVALSSTAGTYAVGTQLTAIATSKGNAEFHSWREGGVVVSREASYTFTVENRNMSLKAYFIEKDSSEDTGIVNSATTAQQTEVIYDLMGRRVKKIEKGIYVVNGKKVVEY